MRQQGAVALWVTCRMIQKSLNTTALSLALLLTTTAAFAQAPAPSTPAKKELVTRLLKLQQPGVEAMSRALVEQPAADLLDGAAVALRSRIAADKEFQWWNEDVEQFRAEKAKKYISLNEAERRAEREKQDKQRVDRQVIRKQLGLDLDPLADDSSDDGLTGNERDIVKDAAREKAAELIQQLKDGHFDILNDLFEDKNHVAFRDLDQFFERLLDIQRFYTLKNITIDAGYDYLYDQIVSFGELMSTNMVSHYLRHTGLPVYWLDVRTVLKTDSRYREGGVNWEVTQQLIQAKLQPLIDSQLVITQGFLGSTVENHTTTLGREGSDYTAAIMAYCLDAEELVIWKDVPGVLNKDKELLTDLDPAAIHALQVEGVEQGVAVGELKAQLVEADEGRRMRDVSHGTSRKCRKRPTSAGAACCGHIF